MCRFSTYGCLSLLVFSCLVVVCFVSTQPIWWQCVFLRALRNIWDSRGKMRFFEFLTLPHWSADASGRKTGRETIFYFPWRRGRARKETHTQTLQGLSFINHWNRKYLFNFFQVCSFLCVFCCVFIVVGIKRRDCITYGWEQDYKQSVLILISLCWIKSLPVLLWKTQLSDSVQSAAFSRLRGWNITEPASHVKPSI